MRFPGLIGKLAVAFVQAIVVVALFAATAAAGPSEERSRELALAALNSQNPQARAAACTLLGEFGRPEDLPRLNAELRDPDAGVRHAAEEAIWRVWGRSGDPEVDNLFDRGVGQMQERDFAAAAKTFSRVIELRPEFAEGWNKRATVYFLLGENDLSLRDCDEVLKRNPAHFGVLAGYGQIFLRKGDLERAKSYFERALSINPNMEGVHATIEAIDKALVERGRRYI